ncbi:MAG TPA: pitrilysin family protein, partial [Pyrinomonadaceae bacterium]|nr:pitrilysin family protein [Pyrinomonadaceae bacterium]
MDKLLAFGLCITLIAGVASGQSSDLPSIQLTEYRLKNGLTVVLHEDHSTPMVSLNVLYKVGSRDEAPGKTGLAHLFEHLMFMGSKNHAYRAAAEELGGGVAAGYTTRDKTVYYSNVPSNYLERILYLEADRMGGFLEILDQSKLDYQRDVVRNERRQHMDNVAHGTVSERLNSVVFPKGHPYHHDIIGSMDDLAAASLDDVSSFFRQHYVPNNAVLSIAGDFEPKQARAWIEQYFGRIAPGTVRRRSSALPRFAGPMRSSYEDRFARDHQIAIAWPAPRAYSPDEAPLQILARILSYDRNSRLNDVLVNKVGLASEVLVRTFSGDLGGFFQIFATARSNRSVEDIEKEIEKEIERIKLDGVSAGEVNRAIATYESSRLDGLQMGWAKGDMIAHYAAAVGRANYLGPDLERFRRVTAADVKRVANRYLIANRFVLSALPAKSPPTGMRVDPPTNTRVREIDPAVRAKQEAMLPKPGPEPKLVLPPVEKTRLSNGLEVWIVQRRVLPLVTMNLVIHAGASADDVGGEGVAAMTSLMIPLGTESRSAKELSDGFQSVGAYFDSYTGGWDSSGLWLQSTKKNLDQALGYYADVIINPRFSEAEFRPLQERTLETIRQPLIGIQILDKVLYADHRYGRLPGGSERSVAAMTREDVRRFYFKHFRPNNATLIVVGDVQPSELVPRLEKALSQWKPAEIVA